MEGSVLLPPCQMRKIGPTSKKRRVLTEDRRRQNRESQQRFREKRKTVSTASGNSSHSPESAAQNASDAANASIPAFSPPNVSTSPPLDLVCLPVSQPSDLAHTDPLDLCGWPVSWSLPFSPHFVAAQAKSSIVATPDATHSVGASTQALNARSASAEQVTGTFYNTVSASETGPLPSVYANHLTLHALNVQAALKENALHIGLPMWLADTVAHDHNIVSPWYWETQFTAMLAAPPGVVIAMEPRTSRFRERCLARPFRKERCFNINENLGKDILPSKLQWYTNHALFLDLLPLPAFREKAISLLMLDPPAFDEEDLRKDIEIHGGLMIWSNGRGRATWDSRSWESPKWFLDKWKMLVDGTALEEQSNWWRSIRGEDDD